MAVIAEGLLLLVIPPQAGGNADRLFCVPFYATLAGGSVFIIDRAWIPVANAADEPFARFCRDAMQPRDRRPGADLLADVRFLPIVTCVNLRSDKCVVAALAASTWLLVAAGWNVGDFSPCQ